MRWSNAEKLGVDPKVVQIRPGPASLEDVCPLPSETDSKRELNVYQTEKRLDFVDIFRGSAPYIDKHRNACMVTNTYYERGEF